MATGEEEGGLGVPSVDNLGGTDKGVVGILLRRYGGQQRLGKFGVG